MNNKKIDYSKCKVVTPEFRASYVHVFKPQSFKGQTKETYSINMLFPKSADLSSIKEALMQAKIAYYGEKKNWPANLLSCVKDGDKQIDKTTGDIKKGHKGHWLISATTGSDFKPQVFDVDGEPMLDQSKFYSGCYGRAHLSAARWEFAGKEGIKFYLDGVQKLKDGEPFGGRPDLSKVFTPVNSNDLDEETEDFA